MQRDSRWVLLPAVLITVWLTMMVSGTGWLDRAVLDAIYSADKPLLRQAAITVTMLGEWQFMLTLALILAVAVALQGAWRQATVFAMTTIIGRLLVELQKIGIGRLRPEERAHLVPVKSLSFPSGHASNSMIVCLAIAMIIVPARHRLAAVAIALMTTLMVGVSRPALGVHWPSDVIGGWSFGAAWVLTMVGLTERWPFEREQRLG
jgi:undecaprenyl-diphosphatase